ncbi:hypothetical protein F5B19DRAFT_486980 [Rostrohypoxylon terebratum]|nr:hypothetical protein F5B19DRAFT_486980 [Rostrohypoxylon terebratum]
MANMRVNSIPPLNVAIVGGGIIGIMTALGLLHRGIRRLDPALLETLSHISQKTSSSTHTRYWDAFHPRDKKEAELETESLLFQIPEKNLAFWGAVRSHLLLAMAAQLPDGVVEFKKQLVNYEDKPGRLIHHPSLHRCHRLSRQCQPHETPRRRTSEKNHESDDRIASLEDRLDGLVSLLESRHSFHRDHDRNREPEEPDVQNDLNHPLSDVDVDVDVDIDIDNNTNTSPASPKPVAALPIPHDLPLTPITTTSDSHHQSSATCLDTFRSRMLPHFPIVHIPDNTTVEQLHHDRPLLLQAIVCVAWPFAREKEARARELKRSLFETALLRQPHHSIDSTVDLLLGLLVYIAWGWDHVHNRSNLSRLVMLCMSLVAEMHLDRPAPRSPYAGNLLAQRFAIPSNHGQLSLELQRAVLGCFVISSAVSEFFASMDAMKWTPQLQEILAAVNTTKACPADTDLVLQVRLQLLATKAAHLRDTLQQQQQQQQQQQTNQAQPSIAAPSILSDAETLHGQLQELRRTPSWSSQHHQPHTHYVELLILETIRHSSLTISRLKNGNSGSAEVGTNGTITDGIAIDEQTSIGYSDLSYMWQSVLTISACTSGLLSLLPSDFVGISFLQWEQLAGCVVILSHLESLRDSRINRAHARAVIDLPVLLDRIADKLSLTATEALEQETNGIFTQLASGIRAFRSNIQGSMVELERPGPSDVSGCGGPNAAAPAQGYFVNSGTKSVISKAV